MANINLIRSTPLLRKPKVRMETMALIEWTVGLQIKSILTRWTDDNGEKTTLTWRHRRTLATMMNNLSHMDSKKKMMMIK
jgi:hypothetical protein